VLSAAARRAPVQRRLLFGVSNVPISVQRTPSRGGRGQTYIVDFTPARRVLGDPLVDGVNAEVTNDELLPQLLVFAGDLRGICFQFFLAAVSPPTLLDSPHQLRKKKGGNELPAGVAR